VQVSSRRSGREKALLGQSRRHLDTEILGACPAQESQTEEGHLMPDHVHQEMANSKRPV